jgi:hypothetical protein
MPQCTLSIGRINIVLQDLITLITVLIACNVMINPLWVEEQGGLFFTVDVVPPNSAGKGVDNKSSRFTIINYEAMKMTRNCDSLAANPVMGLANAII